MCGIAGFTHSRIVPDPSRIREALGCLTHRGPFSTLGAAGQPLVSPDGAIVIAFQGALYNAAELRSELEHRGHQFHTSASAAAETVLAAFREWDTGCFSHLRGMFAVALWNEPARRLILARDRMGIQPLYLARHRGELYFGSAIQAIFAHPEIERRLSPAGLDCYLSLNYVPCPWTLAEGVEKLPPGHWLEWRDGAVRSEPYWRLPDAPQSFWTLDAARSELDSLLKQSIREHLLADVPPGLWLTGDMASSAILHYAASAASGPLKTLSIGIDDSIRRMVSEYGTHHQQIDLAGVMQDFPHEEDDPAAGALPWRLLEGMAQRPVIAGVGADELFGGCPAYRADLLARTARRFPEPFLRLAAPLARRFLEGCLLPPEEAHIYWNGAFTRAQKRALTGPLPPALGGALAELAAAGPSLPAWLRFDQKYSLPDNLLAHSLEVRPPFLDHRIVEFAAALPPDLKIRGGRQSVLLHELMKGKLPAGVPSGNRFDIPIDRWLRCPLQPLLVETLEIGATEYADLFHAPFIRDCLRLHTEGRADLSYPLWGMMLLFLWMKRWRIQTIPPAEARLQATPSIFTSV